MSDLHVMDGLEPPPHPAILVEAGSLILLVLGYGLSPTGSYGVRCPSGSEAILGHQPCNQMIRSACSWP